MYAKCPLEGSGRPLVEIFIGCRKNGTVILLQCSKLSHLVRNIDAPMGCGDRTAWIHEALGRESELGRVLWHHVAQSIIVGGVNCFGRFEGTGLVLLRTRISPTKISRNCSRLI